MTGKLRLDLGHTDEEIVDNCCWRQVLSSKAREKTRRKRKQRELSVLDWKKNPSVKANKE